MTFEHGLDLKKKEERTEDLRSDDDLSLESETFFFFLCSFFFVASFFKCFVLVATCPGSWA